jgi:Flp pilus assembly protein TadD
MKAHNRIVFVPVPVSLFLSDDEDEECDEQGECHGEQDDEAEHICCGRHRASFIDPNIPLPIELPDAESDGGTFNTGDISEEMILAGMLVLLADDPGCEHSRYYRNFVFSARPGILTELTYAAMMKAENRDFDAALEILDILEGLAPASEELAESRAAILEKQAAPPSADTGFSNPEDPFFHEAYASLKDDKPEEALSRIRKFLEKNPDSWNAWFLLGWALRKLGRWEDGATAFRQAKEKGGANSDIHNELAICLIEIGDLKAARRELEAALRYDPENVKIISNLGVVSLKSGNTEEAMGFFRTVLELEPEDMVAREVLGEDGKRERS